jgi:hypothetical protein
MLSVVMLSVVEPTIALSWWVLKNQKKYLAFLKPAKLA